MVLLKFITLIGKRYQNFAQNQPRAQDFLLVLSLSVRGNTPCSWSDRTLAHLFVEIESLNVEGQTLKTCHKENKLYVSGKYTAISRELRFFHNFNSG